MAKAKERNAYRSLTRLMLTVLVLTVLVGTAYVLTDKYARGQLDALTKQVDETNADMQVEYQIALDEYNDFQAKGENPTWPTPAQTGWDAVDLSAFAVDGGNTVTVTRQEMILSGLMLVNRWHSLPGDFPEDQLQSIMTATNLRVQVTDRSVSLLPAAVTALDKMIAGAKEDAGLEYYMARTGYRSMATQQSYWDKKVATLQDRYSGDILTEKARATVSYPGTSDYQSGFSVELDVYNKNDASLNAMDFQSTDQAKWLNEHCWEYGFVFRFPIQNYPSATTVDKSYKTGINLKMDVYRYVGVANAAAMNTLGMCLEEYIEYLAAHPHIAVYHDGTLKYEIFRVSGEGDNSFSIPARAAGYEISIDNMGGTVCAVSF